MPNARYRLSCRASLEFGAAAAGSVLVSLPGRSASAQMLVKVSYQTNWRAQAEHGGFYQAVAAGIYRKYGTDCDLRMGGPQISNSQLLLGGRIDTIMSSGLEAANAQIRKDNPDMTDDKIAYAIKVMNENGIVHSGDALTLGIGAMTDARWQRFYKSMAEVGVLPPGVDPAKGYSLDFVNKGVGKA